jgi:chemotaxis protein CheX
MSDMPVEKAAEVFPAEILPSVIQTFRGMLGVEPKCVENAVVTDLQVASDVSGVIQVRDGNFHVNFVVGFPKETICYIMEKLLRKPYPELNKSAQQGAGEFTNMIYGALKSRVNTLGFELNLALPSVVLGSGHTVEPANGGKAISHRVLRFTFEGKPFSIVLSFFSGK